MSQKGAAATIRAACRGVPLVQGGGEEGLQIQLLQTDGLHLGLRMGFPEGGEKGLRQGAGPGVRSPLADAAVNK